MTNVTYHSKVPSDLVSDCEAMGFLCGNVERHLYKTVNGVQFAYGQPDINYALEKGQALMYRFVRKQQQWYIFCTTQRPEVPVESRYSNGILGIDLNPSVIGWAICDREGNLKAQGQIRLHLNDRSSEQIEATLGDAVKQLVDIASSYKCPIAVEHLNFSKKKISLKEQGVKYSRMLSNFSYGKFRELLSSRTQRFGIELIHLNPGKSKEILKNSVT